MTLYKQKGSLKELLQNPLYTFIQGMGFLHLTFGISAITFLFAWAWNSEWLQKDQMIIESVIGHIIVLIISALLAHGLGRLIEYVQVRFLKQSFVDMNDVWWTTFGGPIAAIIFFVWGADRFDNGLMWASGIVSLVAVVFWLIKKYVKSR